MADLKITASQCIVDSHGQVFKHLVVNLKAEQSIAEIRETPEAWIAIQQESTFAVKKGDSVTLISQDGLSMALECIVTKALAGDVWLGKPSRMVKLEADSLFSDEHHSVVARGTGYCLKRLRDGHVEDGIFATAKAAEMEVVRRQPKKVA